jgi:phosphate transport system ATP-binding protein
MINAEPSTTASPQSTVFQIKDANMYYGKFRAVRDVSLEIPKNKITAFIGPSGCGKSTVLRSLNRLNDVVDGFRLEGEVLYHGRNLYSPRIDPVEVRRRIGMVFQRPNPFPKSIFDNVAYAARVMRYSGNLQERVELTLRRVGLWDEVKDDLNKSGLSLSGGQKQRLCIARAVAAEPEVLLMDEPCSALDPISTARVEELMVELKQKYTIVIVTHNMQQAQRVADMTAFFNAEPTETGGKVGYLGEYNETSTIFQAPEQEITRKYVTGQFG